MIQPHGVLLDDGALVCSVDVGTIVATGTVVDCVSVVTMIAGRVVVGPGAVVVTAVVVVVVSVVVASAASVVVVSATVRVRAGSDPLAVCAGLVAVTPVRVPSALPLPPPPHAASAKPAKPAIASMDTNIVA
jgi:hypothetical protein